MSPKVDKIGRSAAVISSLILFALLLNLWVLQADAKEKNEQIPTTQFASHHVEPANDHWMDQAVELFSFYRESGTSVPASDMSEKLETVNRNGKPIAYVNMEKLYLVDRRGRIIASADSSSHYNLPIITGDGFYIDDKYKMLVDDGFKDAVELLKEIQNRRELEPLLSEIKVADNGIVAYFGFGHVTPVIFGVGGWRHKIDNLIAYQQQLGGSKLAEIAAYLDLRIEDRIVVKKNV